MRPLPRLLGAALLALSIAAPDARAGYRMTDESGDLTLVSRGRVKELSEEGEGPQSVFDLSTARAWMSNPERKVYWEGTIEELCTSFRQAAVAMAKSMEAALDSQLAKLPPGERAKVDAMRKAAAAEREAKKKKAGPGVIKVERTSETATIAGQPTRKFRVLADGVLYEEDWLTTDPSFAKEFALDKASAVMSRVSACAQAGETEEGGGGVDEGRIYEKLYPQGWPLKAVSHIGDKTRTKTEITEIQKRDIADAEFLPPAGYQKAPLAEVMFSGMNGSGRGD